MSNNDIEGYVSDKTDNSEQEGHQDNNKSKQLAATKLFFYKQMNEFQRAKNKKKHKKCFEILTALILECLHNYNIVRDLQIIQEFQNLIKQVVYLHKYKSTVSRKLKQRFVSSLIELDQMLFNLRYFSLNIFITKILNKNTHMNTFTDNKQSWGHLYDDNYFPKNPDLKYIYLNFIRYKKFQDDDENQISLKDAFKNKNEKQIQEIIDKRNENQNNFIEKNMKQQKFQMANNYIKDFVINESKQKEMMQEDFNINSETTEFIKVFLDLMIYNGFNCKKNKQFRIAYQYFHQAYNCCLIFEKYQNLIIIAYCIKIRLIFAAFLLELKKYKFAEEILIVTLQLQQYEIIKLDYNTKDFKTDHEQIYYKKINTLICTLMNLIYCYKYQRDFEKLNEVIQIIQMLNGIDLENNIVELFNSQRKKILDIKKMFKQIIDKIITHKLNTILHSIGEIRLLTTDLLQQDLFLHQLGKKENETRIQQKLILKQQFKDQIPNKQQFFKDVSSKIIYKSKLIEEQTDNNSQQQEININQQNSVKKELSTKISYNQSSTRVLEQKDTFSKRKRAKSEVINNIKGLSQQFSDPFENKGSSILTKNQNFCDSFELDQSFNFETKTSLLSIRDLKKQINQKFSKQLNYKLCRREFQLQINDEYKPQLVMEESFFDDFKDNSKPIAKKKQNYDDIHMSRFQQQINAKIKNRKQYQNNQEEEKDLSFEDEMKQKIADTEKMFIYQNFNDIENKQSIHDKNQLQYEKRFNFYKKILRFKSREAIRTHKNIQYGIPGKPHKVVVDKKQSKEILGFKLNDQIEQNRQLRKIKSLTSKQNQLNKIVNEQPSKNQSQKKNLKSIILRHPEVFNLVKWCQKNNALNQTFQKKQSQSIFQTIIQKNQNLSQNFNKLPDESKIRIYSSQYKQTNLINLNSLDESKAKLLLMSQPSKLQNKKKRQSKILDDYNDLATNCLK